MSGFQPRAVVSTAVRASIADPWTPAEDESEPTAAAAADSAAAESAPAEAESVETELKSAAPPAPEPPRSRPTAFARSSASPVNETQIRQQLVEAQFQARAIEMRLEQARAELKALSGFGLTGLFAGLTGSRSQRTEALNEACAALESQLNECRAALTGLERDLAGVEGKAADRAAADAARQRELAERREQLALRGGDAAGKLAQLDERLAAAKAAVDDAQRAIDAGDQARKDLHEEIETMSMSGRCNLAAAGGLLKTVMQHGRRSAASECADRVRRGVARLHRKMQDLIDKHGPDAESRLIACAVAVKEMESRVSASWIESGPGGGREAAAAHELLSTAGMLMSARRDELKRCVKQIEEEQRALVEGA